MSRSTAKRYASPTAGKQTVKGVSEFMNCSIPSSVVRSTPVKSRQLINGATYHFMTLRRLMRGCDTWQPMQRVASPAGARSIRNVARRHYGTTARVRRSPRRIGVLGSQAKLSKCRSI